MVAGQTSDLLGQSLGKVPVMPSSEPSSSMPLSREGLYLCPSFPTNNLGLLRHLFVAVPGPQ